MSIYTRSGYKLEFTPDPNALFFGCFNEQVVLWTPQGFQRTPGGLLARLQIIAPCTRGDMVSALRAWLSVYGDPDLLEQVDSEVDRALAGMPEFRPSAQPPNDPQKGQTN
jgi:hypothetical protein